MHGRPPESREAAAGFPGGRAPIDMQALIALMTDFSGLLMKLADQVTSIDLNPVFLFAGGMRRRRCPNHAGRVGVPAPRVSHYG